MKSKRFYFIGAILAAAVGTFAYQNYKGDKISDLALDNIEAISRSEIGENCGGCSSEYDGSYCCILEIYGIPYTLYHPRN